MARSDFTQRPTRNGSSKKRNIMPAPAIVATTATTIHGRGKCSSPSSNAMKSMIGRCNRYTPYERRPNHAGTRNEKNLDGNEPG